MILNETLPRFFHYYERFEGFGVWAAIEKATGVFLGWFEFRPPEGGGLDEVELGYRLRKLSRVRSMGKSSMRCAKLTGRSRQLQDANNFLTSSGEPGSRAK